MAQRYELNDRQWAAIEPLLPKQGRGGAWKDHRTIINGISWRLHTGAPWRDLPERYGPWQTVYDRFVRWRKDGTWLRLMHALQRAMRLQDELDLDVLFIDSSVVRATRAAAGARKKGARRTSHPTTPWAAHAAVIRRSSTSSPNVTALHWQPPLPPGRPVIWMDSSR
jgi:transposase